ncbi:MAG: RNA-binding protein [Candidatus Thermofonsia Clade 1 bacterium]|jgi:RNA recognition motif-containing protein|uniref:RNA-binding protein n=1 Tax=Candidatus Thermofonsia Clade 1 bacterium TaxID=2364210 RepID=A0A2M8PD22_9CHLR|nr:MAG: RNA-binding protein [Candidatus Thermofonsia Clade 1 bacterium]RMF52480.1 MAG: RNA-binding protein [Chloroflexota bacterium]
MAKKLYVGNLSYESTPENVRALFAEAGEVVDVAIIMDRETGRSRGFGFVEMATDEGGREAIKRFDGFVFQNRKLTVNEARPRTERSDFGSGGRTSRGSDRSSDRSSMRRNRF